MICVQKSFLNAYAESRLHVRQVFLPASPPRVIWSLAANLIQILIREIQNLITDFTRKLRQSLQILDSWAHKAFDASSQLRIPRWRASSQGSLGSSGRLGKACSQLSLGSGKTCTCVADAVHHKVVLQCSCHNTLLLSCRRDVVLNCATSHTTQEETLKQMLFIYNHLI